MTKKGDHHGRKDRAGKGPGQRGCRKLDGRQGPSSRRQGRSSSAGHAKEKVGHAKDKVEEAIEKVEHKAGEVIDKTKDTAHRD